MEQSIALFEHIGMFYIALKKLMTDEHRKNIISIIDPTLGPGDIEQRTAWINFNSFLQQYRAVSDSKSGTIRDAVKLKDAAKKAGYYDVVSLCNKWMGLPEESVPESEMDGELKIVEGCIVYKNKNYKILMIHGDDQGLQITALPN